MKRLLELFVLFTIPLLALACSGDSDDGDDATTSPTTAATEDAVAPEDMLNSLEDVRAVIVSAATDLDPAIVDDVDYTDGTLTVMLAEDQDVSDADSMASTCEDISSAVALPDLSVRLESPDGEIVAECSFAS
jgi:hypothetical protein